MKTNHGAVINKRVKENYGDSPNKNVKGILHKLTKDELDWVRKYEKLEYAIERSFKSEALTLAQELNPNISQSAVERIEEDLRAKQRCNPNKAEAIERNQKSKTTSDRSNNSNNYDRLDWLRSGGMTIDDDGIETDIGITTNPEDALIDMLDAAKAKNVDLTTYMNDPQYWVKPNEAHRPEKISDTQVQMIRDLKYLKTRAQVAQQFGISSVMVSLIWNNKVRVLESK